MTEKIDRSNEKGVIPQRGRLTDDQTAFVYAHLSDMTDEELALAVGKKVSTITKMRQKHPAIKSAYGDANTINTLELQLQTKFFWPELQKQLFPHELDFFKSNWVALTNQFADQGIVVTDEMMMRDLIVTDILYNRNLTERRRIEVESETIQKIIDLEMEKPPETRNVDRIGNLQSQLNQFFAVKESLAKEANVLQQRKDAKFRDLKSTREQRYKQVEEAKTDFFALVRELSTLKMRRSEGRRNALCQLCVEKEKERLSKPHKFTDSLIDIPFLSPEVVMLHKAQQELEKTQENDDEEN